ncbi:MFS DHA1 transporter [Laccaria bicolor S238N-H82]|uniref:MFS DHA1 transporter n=1 Tax=Laccaria bicolor (strain S238N-H82 / ATCC MYA-4686) TaxID=486041 RepID=B0DUI5_LACBS|nr:MFS DHA1 transporter [Laccaria bicolor S238N-H82]EDR01813.1 MFS DHA1 transporter [Laccaria bicolor S238N-H82]|eukprot:XP_001887626.1 MFS DHA1 transporter [Laccaria bicolor S238N-H82]
MYLPKRPDEKSSGCDVVSTDAIAEVNQQTTEFYFLPIPSRLRYDPENPFRFSYKMLVSYAIVGFIITANLYYCQPLLIQMSKSFQVSYEGVSRIPTFVQAGHASGLLLICPLGDLVHRRQLILALLLMTTFLTLGLAVTSNLHLFEALSFLSAATSLTPQILVPLAADLAPPAQSGFAFSIVLTGIMLGVLLGRVMAGLIAQFLAWRVVYYTSFGLQCLILVCIYLFFPDYPPHRANNELAYWEVFWTMGKYIVTEPLVMQIVIINLGAAACFANYWVTLTFLLGGAPYFYSTLVIGLFGLLGMAGVMAGPICGRIVDKMGPWHALLAATFMLLLFQAVHTGAAGIHISAVIISCFGSDLFQQIQNVALPNLIFSVSSSAASRLNAIYMISYYVGQMIGTSVGTKVFVRYGWRASAALGMAWYAMQIVVILIRGPNCRRYIWFGYEGGTRFRGRQQTVDFAGDHSTIASESEETQC